MLTELQEGDRWLSQSVASVYDYLTVRYYLLVRVFCDSGPTAMRYHSALMRRIDWSEVAYLQAYKLVSQEQVILVEYDKAVVYDILKYNMLHLLVSLVLEVEYWSNSLEYYRVKKHFDQNQVRIQDKIENQNHILVHRASFSRIKKIINGNTAVIFNKS